MYDDAFYDLVRPGARASAQVLAPALVGWVNPTHIIDVGCGEGWFAHQFALAGRAVLGVDGGPRPTGSPLTVDQYDTVDLTAAGWWKDLPRAQLALCLEVGEHLPASAAEGLVEGLCALAPVIAFSAAIPGQGGHHHINEQWQSWWAGLFEAQYRFVSGAARWGIWDDEVVEPWYRQNLLIVADNPERVPSLFGPAATGPLDVVHPATWSARVPR